MVEEARLERSQGGLAAKGEGWYVVNARDSRWFESQVFGRWCHFEGDVRFPELGINITRLEPGDVTCMYHGESNQEDFLVLSGECVLLIEGEERPLRAWDFVHCPPWTEHVIVAGSVPCVVLAVGARKDDDGLIYPVAEVAARHGASVLEETSSGKEAYARFPKDVESSYRDRDLPDW
jgi:uncharacterized cupin superfamily protein